MPERFRYDLLRETQELENFRPAWETLWREDAHATPFQNPRWLLPWWHQFGELDLRAIVISGGRGPIAFLPFYVYREPATQERQLLMLGVGTSDYLDGVFAPECGAEQIRIALNLLGSEGGWDVLYASQLRQQSLLFRALQQTEDSGIHMFAAEPCSRMRACRIAELPTKLRRNAMYYRNRAQRMAKLDFAIADERSWPEFFDALVHLHTSRWKSQGEPGVLADRRVLDWHRETIPLLQQQDMLRLCSLRLNGEAIGVAYSLVDPVQRPNRTQYVYLTAHSVEHADLRSGTILLALLSEHAASEGIEIVDMLRGDEDYKKLWHVEPVPTYGAAMLRVIGERRLRSA